MKKRPTLSQQLEKQLVEIIKKYKNKTNTENNRADLIYEVKQLVIEVLYKNDLDLSLIEDLEIAIFFPQVYLLYKEGSQLFGNYLDERI